MAGTEFPIKHWILSLQLISPEQTDPEKWKDENP